MIEPTHRMIQRVKRRIERGIRFCKKNDIELVPALWVTSDHKKACALGAVLLEASHPAVSENFGWRSAIVDELALSCAEISAFTHGFDNESDPVTFASNREARMHQLGVEMSNKYLNG